MQGLADRQIEKRTVILSLNSLKNAYIHSEFFSNTPKFCSPFSLTMLLRIYSFHVFSWYAEFFYKQNHLNILYSPNTLVSTFIIFLLMLTYYISWHDILVRTRYMYIPSDRPKRRTISSVSDPKRLFPDPAFQVISDPDYFWI